MERTLREADDALAAATAEVKAIRSSMRVALCSLGRRPARNFHMPALPNQGRAFSFPALAGRWLTRGNGSKPEREPSALGRSALRGTLTTSRMIEATIWPVDLDQCFQSFLTPVFSKSTD